MRSETRFHIPESQIPEGASGFSPRIECEFSEGLQRWALVALKWGSGLAPKLRLVK